jgi:hypothetical protein
MASVEEPGRRRGALGRVNARPAVATRTCEAAWPRRWRSIKSGGARWTTLPRSRFSSSGGLACSPSRTNDGRKTTGERVHFYASKSVATCLLHGRGHMHDSPVTHVSVFVTFDLDPSLPSPLINESESSSLRQCSCGCGDYLLPYPLGSSTRL